MDIEDEEDYSNVEGANAMFGKVAFIWPKHPVRPWPLQASVTEAKPHLEKFRQPLRNYSRRQYGDKVEMDPVVSVVNSTRITYPSWMESEIIGDISEMPRRPSQVALPATYLMISSRISANYLKCGRHDAVLVTVKKERLHGRLHSMTHHKVARVILLFQCSG
jgi:hypothetical protein